MNHVSTAKVTLHNGEQMPVLGLGAFEIEGNVSDAVLNAIRIGYRLIDTAAMYRNEAGVGDGVRRAVEQGLVKREDVFVTTKVWTTELGYDKTMAAFERSYRELGLDVVDLYLIHWPGTEEENIGSWKALIELQKQGSVRNIGVSNFAQNHLQTIIEQTGVVPVVNQVEYHPSRSRRELHRHCRELGIQLQAWGPLGKGKLVSDPLFAEIGKTYNKTPAQVILRWVIQNGVITIPKSSREERMRENADIFDFELSAEDMERIDALDR
jgi:diketogulonate reductase-like aldo/keto reductase